MRVDQPQWEKPQIVALDDVDAAEGNGPDCNQGSHALGSCTPGSLAGSSCDSGSGHNE